MHNVNVTLPTQLRGVYLICTLLLVLNRVRRYESHLQYVERAVRNVM